MTEPTAPGSVGCIVVADVSGSSPLYERLGAAEGHRAVERCLNRMERVIIASGRVLATEGDEIVALFPDAEEALFSATEMQHRVSDLPPVSGVKLAIRIGAHTGVLGDGNAIDSHATGIARNLCDLAASGQILTTQKSLMTIQRAARPSARPIESLVYDEDGPLTVTEVLWGSADDGTKIDGQTAPYIPLPKRMRVRYKGTDHYLSAKRTRLSFGRDGSSDVAVHDTRASRNHARMEFRANGFFLVDSSTNGTCVQLDGMDPCVVHGGEMVLFGKGVMTFGRSVTEGVEDIVEFEILP